MRWVGKKYKSTQSGKRGYALGSEGYAVGGQGYVLDGPIIKYEMTGIILPNSSIVNHMEKNRQQKLLNTYHIYISHLPHIAIR